MQFVHQSAIFNYWLTEECAYLLTLRKHFKSNMEVDVLDWFNNDAIMEPS